MQVKLFKKNVEYTNKDGEVKTATNYFLECGDVLIPVEVKYFKDKETGEDKNYRVRKSLMSAFAEELPERKKENAGQAKESKQAKLVPIDDPTLEEGIPF